MARTQRFLNAELAEQITGAYADLQQAQRAAVDKAVIALLKQQLTPGVRVKPIEPDKFDYVARINDGDRLIHRSDGGVLHVVDVVTHDDIARYGRERAHR